MAITQVESRESVNVILIRTEKAWIDEGYKVKRNNAIGWDIISAMGEKCMVTLQLSSRNGAFGYISRSTPAKLSTAIPESLGAPIPGNAKVNSTVVSDDDGREGLTMSMTSSLSLEDLNKFFALQLNDYKWTGIKSHEIRGVNGKDISSITVSAQRDRKHIDIIMWPEREVQIVMTISEAL